MYYTSHITECIVDIGVCNDSKYNLLTNSYVQHREVYGPMYSEDETSKVKGQGGKLNSDYPGQISILEHGHHSLTHSLNKYYVMSSI